MAMAHKTITPASVEALIKKEFERNQATINLIASENYSLAPVRAAMGSIASSKYAEGYPGRRYYAGCSVMDEIETAAQDALLDLFLTDDLKEMYHANVQSHAGSQANIAVYNALLKPGDTILSMSLSHGGHLTHGHPINVSGQTYTIVSYHVNEEEGVLDYDEIERLALEHKPTLIIAGASAYSRTIDFARFGAIAKQCGALLLTDIAHIAGLAATGQHPSPFPYADIVTSTTHKTLRGPRGAFIICKKELAKKIDMSVMPGMQGGPFMHAIAARAVAFSLAKEESFKAYIKEVLACSSKLASLLASRGYHIVSGGTDNHLFMVNFARSRGFEELTGREAEAMLEEVGIIVNRNTIPGDKRSPLQTSGMRIGLAGMVTRGMTTNDMEELAALVDCTLRKTLTQEQRERITAIAHACRLPE
jgi:glycine hydroxymethyltransferase